MTDTTQLVVKTHVRATPATVFDAWTDPDEIVHWWGPEGVRCTHAEVDLRVGGRFRIANLGPDGSTTWIAGIYEQIERPRLLRHTWFVESSELPRAERVTVEFSATSTGTEITVTHEDIATKQRRDGHEQGWLGCLGGLVERLEPPPA